MGCLSRAIQLIILVGLMASVKNTAVYEDDVRKISNEYEKWHKSGNVIIKLIALMVEPITYMQKGPDNDSLVRIFNLFGDVISELAEVGEVNVSESFRSVLRNIENVKKIFSSVPQNIELACNIVNKSRFDQTVDSKQWKTKVTDKKRIYKSTCHVVDDLIYMGIVQLHNCCNITITPIISLCQSFRTLLANGSGYMANMAHILNRINICLENKSFYLEYTARCFHFVYNEINNIIRKFIRLLNIQILYSKCCISLALVEKSEKK